MKNADEKEILAQGLPKVALELVKDRIARFAFKREMPEIAQI